MIFFYFLKIIFNISTSKRFKNYKPHLILTKKIQNLTKYRLKHTAKQPHVWVLAGWLAGFFTALLLIL